MPLILTMTQTKGTQARGAPAQGGARQIRTLAQGTLSIGRAPGNDWVLADPDQHLSRTHCLIAFEGGRYMLTDLSTNGLLINGAREPTTRNSRFTLTDGDTVQLGTWQLAVAESDDPGAAAGGFGSSNFITPRDPFSSSGGGDGPLDIDPLDDPLGNYGNSAEAGFQHHLSHLPPAMRAEDPFDRAEGERGGGTSDEDLFQGKTPTDAWQGPTQHDRSDMGAQAFAAPRVVAPINVADIDFDDLLGDLMPTAAPHPLAPEAAPPGPASFPPHGARPAAPPPAGFDDGLDDLLGDFAPAPGGAPPTTPPQAPPPQTPPAQAAPQPASRPMTGPMTGAPASAPSAPPPPTATEPLPSTPVAASAAPSPFDAPPPPRTAALPLAATQAVASATAPADQKALLAAFAEGAGLPNLDLLAPGHAPGGQAEAIDPQAAMRAIGALFAAFVGGTREVLMSRAEIKHEMRVEQTMMRARDNNALKFSISAQEALAALLQPNRPGYKAPLAAIEEAFNDIRSHEMAVMAGLQTALLALLKRFDPEALEGRLQRGMLDAVLPGARKARFWELFCGTYKDIAREAEDDFQSVFGREFARAYDAQIRKL